MLLLLLRTQTTQKTRFSLLYISGFALVLKKACHLRRANRDAFSVKKLHV
jgi:hypothetical protein